MGKLAVTAGIVAFSLTAGAIVAGIEYERNQLPDFILSPLGYLPPTIPNPALKASSLICADTIKPPEAIKPCAPSESLGILATANQIDVPLAQTGSDNGRHSVDALLSAEDNDFFNHKGVNVKGIARAGIVDIATGAFRQGGSSVEQELLDNTTAKATLEELQADGGIIKILADRGDASSLKLARQMHQARAALTMDQMYSKNQILEKYFNSVPFGRGAIGIQAAAQADFAIDAKNMSLEQSAYEIGKLRAPSCADGVPDGCTNKTGETKVSADIQLQREAINATNDYKKVINDMHDTGRLSDTDYTYALAHEPARIPYVSHGAQQTKLGVEIGAQHFNNIVVGHAAGILGITKDQFKAGGYTVITTLNIDDERVMHSVITSSPLIKGDVNAAGISEKSDGAITAEIGSVDYDKLQQDLTLGKAGGGSGRDLGSVYKGLEYAYAFDHGAMPGDVIHIDTAAKVYPNGNGNGTDWVLPTDEKGCDLLGLKPPCDMTEAQALAVSSDDEAANLAIKFGIEPIAQSMVDIGVDFVPPFKPTLILGEGDGSIVSVNAAYAGLLLDHGRAVQPYVIKQIIDHNGNIVYEHQPQPSGVQVYSVNAAHLTATALEGVLVFGTGKGASTLPPQSIAGKTGTAATRSDLSFVGAACDVATGGDEAAFTVLNPKGKIPLKFTSRQIAQMWAAYMQYLPNRDRNCDIAA